MFSIGLLDYQKNTFVLALVDDEDFIILQFTHQHSENEIVNDCG